jgi:beta-galactosidase
VEKRRRTRFDRRGLVIDGGEPLPIRSGSLHYWRLEPGRWRGALAAMADAGFNAVTTYIPWSVHERGAGDFDFTGDRDVAAFLDAAAGAGLMAIVRPGPHINAELTLFGIPERVLEQPACQALTASGTPAWLPAPPRMFPIPSYASPIFIDETRRWLAAVGEAIAGHDAVAAIQLDNEMAMFFRTGAFDLDYHPGALAWWRELHGDLEPPRTHDPAAPEAGARWVLFKEKYAARSMAWIAAALEDAGLGELARFHNGPPIAPVGLAPLAAGEAAGSMAAWDCYQTLRSARRVREIGLYLAGSTVLPFVAELGVGGPAYAPVPTPEAQASAAIALLGSGVAAFNLYMAVDRDRWIDAAMDVDGRIRAAWVERFLAALAELGDARIRPLVGLVESRADHRYAIASSVIDPAPPAIAELVDFGPGGFAELGLDAEARLHARWRAAIASALEEFEIPWAVVDQDAGVEAMARFELLVCPTIRRIDAGLWATLREVAAAGTRVVIGPGQPRADELEHPLDAPGLVANMGLLRAETLGDIDALGTDLAGAAPELPDLWIAPGSPAVIGAPLWRGDTLAALVVINSGAEIADARIAAEPGAVLIDAMSGELVRARGEVLALRLEPRSARLLLPQGA